mmetsp:Transcript_48347/g.119788  ORF Transcript_48347/g.119788 Transcript_48347/m.119788 type:complete len:237 (-) Transcript_48347:69-779(-)
MVAVTVPAREMELKIQRLQVELRHAHLENESIRTSMNRTIEGLQVELMRGRHAMSYWRRKAMGKGEKDNTITEANGDSDDPASSVEDDEQEEEHQEEGEGEKDPLVQKYVGNRRRQQVAKQVWQLLREMTPGCAAHVLSLAARRARALSLLLKQKGLERSLRSVKQQALMESKEFMLNNQVAAINWCKWMLQSHVSRSKMAALRDRLCFNRILVETNEDDSDDEPVSRRTSPWRKL